jgi:hypothetical protein
VVAVFKHQFCAPYAERQFRHQALVWAAAIARSRGWRMRLFGNGWDRHPGLAEFAAGPLEHGEALRASYQSAAVHLHMSTYSVVHQRVMECALSGGFPACRLQRREVDSVCHRLLEEAVRTGVPHSVSVNGYAYYRTEDCPSLAVRAALEEGLGIEARRSYVASPAVMERVRSLPPGVDLFQADLLLGDLVTRTFHDRASLEALLVRAVEQPGWRGEALASIARRVRESMTYDVFCRRLLGLLTARLGGDERSVW